jgi:hypothetical protein
MINTGLDTGKELLSQKNGVGSGVSWALRPHQWHSRPLGSLWAFSMVSM